jgi:hypothetical protein
LLILPVGYGAHDDRPAERVWHFLQFVFVKGWRAAAGSPIAILIKVEIVATSSGGCPVLKVVTFCAEQELRCFIVFVHDAFRDYVEVEA